VLRTTAAVALAGALACGCTLALAYPERSPESSATACADEVDNDADGRADCYDPDCASFCAEDCTNSVDDDLDGATDCADTDCSDDPRCEEAGAALCADGADNDGDRRIDCDDDSCVGFCPEDDAATCSDGWDNDGDGLVDDGDPRCWLVTPLVTRRCASVEGSVLSSAFASVDDVGSDFYFTDGAPVQRRPPILGGAIELTAGMTAGTQRALAGTWEGTELELLVDGDVRLLLAPSATTGVDTPAFAAFHVLDVTVAGDTLRVAVPGAFETAELEPRDGWQLLTIVVRDGEIVVGLEPVAELGSGSAVSTDPIRAPRTEQLDVRLLLTGPGTLARVEASFGRLDPCPGPVPSIDAPSEDVGLDVAAAFWTNPSGGKQLCGLAVGCGPALQLYATSLEPTLVAPAPLGISASAVGLDYDPDSDLLHAVVTDPSDGRLRFFDSTDCVNWTERTVEGAPRVGPRYRNVDACASVRAVGLGGTVSYVVRDQRPDRARVHEIYWRTETGAGGVLARAVSTDGGASFGAPEIVLDGMSLGPMVEVTAPGDELLIAQVADPTVGEVGVRIGVFADGEYTAVPGPPLFPPSGVPGTFDRDAIRSVALETLGNGAFVLLGGLGDYQVPSDTDRRVRLANASFDAEDEDVDP